MKSAVGIIAEFNPFHNGHRYLIKRAKELTNADVVIVVMSGNWVQRGIPATVDKWQRAKMALANGADLVIELPAQFAVQPADIFASRAVQLIGQLGCGWLTFGCEHPDLDFDRLAQIKLKPSHRFFQNYRCTYATLIRQNFYRQTGIKITSPNDLLALSYARAKRSQDFDFKLIPIQRSSSHDESRLSQGENRFTSSSAIRRQLFSSFDLKDVKNWMPDSCVNLMKCQWINWDSFWPLLRYRIIESSLMDLKSIYQMREGLEHRLKKSAVQAATFRHFLQLVKTKRYTYSAILRVCFYLLIHLTKKDWQRIKDTSYLRILGFNIRGRKYLNQLKQHSSILLITNVNQKALHSYLKWDFRAGMLFQMKLHRYEDLYQHPLIK